MKEHNKTQQMFSMYFYRLSFLFFLFAIPASAQQKIVSVVSFENKTENPEQIIYSRDRPLQLSDFEGEYEQGSNAVAMAYSGVGVQYDGSIKKGLLQLSIKLLVSFDKDRSWCLERSRDAYTLAHEQRHFDITALNACALFRALQSYPFTANLNNEIASLQEKYKRINEAEQDQYDAEVNHGINKEAQELWNKKIKERLAACADCYGN